MAIRIDDFLSEVASGGGMAMGNLFKVRLPDLTRFGGPSGRKMELLCTDCSLPNRQILTAEKRSGFEVRKVGYGYTSGDVTLQFHLLNDFGARHYFETWQDLIVNQQSKNMGYHNEYTDDVVIQQLRKGVSFPVARKKLFDAGKIPSSIRGRLPRLGPLDFAQGEFDLDAVTPDDVIYECKLLDAFPTSMTEISLSADTGLLKVQVILSYTNWESKRKDIKTSQLGEALVGGAVQFVRGLF